MKNLRYVVLFSATLIGDFAARGGITTRVTAQWARKKK